MRAGDFIQWAQVPNNTLVAAGDEMGGHILRRGNKGDWSQPSDGAMWFDFDQFDDAWPWDHPQNDPHRLVQLVAVDVPASASARDLQALAEAFHEAHK